MSFRTTLTLLVILAVVGLAAFLLRPQGEVNPWDQPTPTLAGDASTPLLKQLQVDVHRITRLTLAPSGKNALTFERIGDGWQLTAPIVLPLKTAQFEGLILAPLQEVQDLGDADPISHTTTTASLELTTAQGTTRLNLGPNLGAGIGLLETGGKTLRASSHLHDLLANLPPLANLVSPQLDLPPLESLTRLEAQTPRGHAQLLRGKTGWTFDAPGAPRANLEALHAYCAVLCGLKIVEIPQETTDEKLLGLDRPIMQFALTQAGGTTTRLEIGGPTGPTASHYFIRLSQPQGAPLIATVDTQQIASLVKGEDFFRDMRVALMKKEDVRRVRVEQDGKTTLDLSLNQDGQVVFTDKTMPFALDAELGEASFGAVFGLRTKQAAAIAAPSHQLILTDAFGREEKVRLMASGENFAVQREGDASGFSVPKAQLAPLLMGAAELRDREIRWLPENGDLTEIKLEQGFCGLKFEFEKKDGQWVAKDGGAFEEMAVMELERALRRPKAEKFLDPEISKKFNSDVALEATARASDHDRRLDLAINPTGWGTLFIPDDRNDALQVSPRLAQLLHSEFRPRQLLALAPDQIASIHVNAIPIMRRADGTYDADHPNLTQADCARLFDALGNLRAESPIAKMEDGTQHITLTLHTLAGDTHTLRLRDECAAFADRSFVWDPTSPQAKAVQAILDQIKK